MRNFTICLLLVTLFISCDESDDGSQEPTPTELQGAWELQDVSCFCFFPEDFDFGGHKLEFNTAANEVLIENSEEAFFIMDAGIYPIAVENNRITFNSGVKYNYQIENDTLQLSFVDDALIADDEILLTYFKQ